MEILSSSFTYPGVTWNNSYSPKDLSRIARFFCIHPLFLGFLSQAREAMIAERRNVTARYLES